jgi:hypothetical protein
MPAHFTHIYTARRVADLLAGGDFVDWPEGVDVPYDPVTCGTAMRDWEKFTAVGAIGPDLFYFSQDYNTEPVGQRSDVLMLALATYYYMDAAKEDDWEPLLIILEEVSSTMAALLRFLIKLEKIWKSFVQTWDDTIGPLVDAASSVLDDLTGGLISQFSVAIDELQVALKTIGEEELLTFHDIFGGFDTCVQKGWSESAFLWSDMSHYRRTTAMCQNLVRQAELLKDGTDEGEVRFRQFLAFSLGYITHVGTDTIAHSFVNEQCGGPYRDHPQRHHLIENHIDAWNYQLSGKADSGIPNDPWGSTATYPELSFSALHYAVQMTPEDPHGAQRPATVPDDHAGRKKALDVDGELPDWMCDSIVKAMIATFADTDHPQIYGGSDFQSQIDEGLLTQVFQTITGHGLDQPFADLLQGIAPTPNDFTVPHGFPMPWQIQTMYRLMISYYKFSFEGSWELQKPKKPDFIIVPPASDIENLFQPPDFSGVDSDNPAVDICEALIALIEWAIKELGAAAKLAGDLIKMAASPGTYLLRLGLYELSMMVWDVITKTHEVLAHTGFMAPHGEVVYDDGELRLPNEIDLPLITLGSTTDAAFQQALADAFDPMANLDKDPSVFAQGHSVTDPRYPYYPVLRYHQDNPGLSFESWEFRRPWAYPDMSQMEVGGQILQWPTPTEQYDPSLPPTDPPTTPPPAGYPGLRPGPYPAGTRPDQVFFRTDAPVDRQARGNYEKAQRPADTDELNAIHLQTSDRPLSPLGDPVPFSAYLIGRLANPTEYDTQFNLDSDRAFAYLTWDWIRGDVTALTETNETKFKFQKPNVAPQAEMQEPPGKKSEWNATGADKLQLHYVDAPTIPKPAPPGRGRRRPGQGPGAAPVHNDPAAPR